MPPASRGSTDQSQDQAHWVARTPPLSTQNGIRPKKPATRPSRSHTTPRSRSRLKRESKYFHSAISGSTSCPARYCLTAKGSASLTRIKPERMLDGHAARDILNVTAHETVNAVFQMEDQPGLSVPTRCDQFLFPVDCGPLQGRRHRATNVPSRLQRF